MRKLYEKYKGKEIRNSENYMRGIVCGYAEHALIIRITEGLFFGWHKSKTPGEKIFGGNDLDRYWYITPDDFKLYFKFGK